MLNNFCISQKSFIYFYWHKTVYTFNVDEFKDDCGLMVLDFIVKTYVLCHAMNISGWWVMCLKLWMNECFYNIITWNYEEMLPSLLIVFSTSPRLYVNVWELDVWVYKPEKNVHYVVNWTCILSLIRMRKNSFVICKSIIKLHLYISLLEILEI